MTLCTTGTDPIQTTAPPDTPLAVLRYQARRLFEFRRPALPDGPAPANLHSLNK